MIATQNVGSDWPSTEMIWAARSMPVPLFTAARMPRGNAMARDTPIAKRASLSELGSRSRSSSLTGRRARIEVPKSPVTARPTKDEVLLDVGAIEAEVAAGVVEVLLGRRHRQDHVQRVAGGPGQDEHHHREDGQRDQRLQRAGTSDEAEHACVERRGAALARRRHSRGSATCRPRAASRNRSYMTVPGFHLPSVLDVA